MSFRKLAALCAAFLCVSGPASATSWEQEFGARVKARQTVTALSSEMFGEHISLYDGTTSFSTSDISLPGNSGLSVDVSRSMRMGHPGAFFPDELFGDWGIDVPYLKGLYSKGDGWGASSSATASRCTNNTTPGWGTNELSVPGGGGGAMLWRNSAPKTPEPQVAGLSGYTTKSRWYFQCLPALKSGQAGEGFLGIAPDGSKYYFDWLAAYNYPGTALPGLAPGSQIQILREEDRIYPTRVEDRFGNWVNYQWSGRKLLSIAANDGRRIDLTYKAGTEFIETATAAGKVWTYMVDSSRYLRRMTNPDGSAWAYSGSAPSLVDYKEEYERYNCRGDFVGGFTCQYRLIVDKTVNCAWADFIVPTPYSYTVSTPSGASARFSFQAKRFGRRNVPRRCEEVTMGDDGSNTIRNWHNVYQPFYDAFATTEKRVNGPGLTEQVWSYGYDGLDAGYAPFDGSYVPGFRTTTVTQPDGVQMVQTFGRDYGINDGQLLRSETRKDGVAKRVVQQQYVTNAEVASMPFSDNAGIYQTYEDGVDTWGSTAVRPVRSATTTQEGSTFTTETLQFDAFARPVSTKKTGAVGP